MLKNTFEDDIHSALESAQACAHAIKLCDNAVERYKINLAIRKIKQCARLVKCCDAMFKDHRGLRASKPGRATSWEIRTTLNLPENANISMYSGKVNPDGSVDVWDDKYYGKRGGKLIGHAEASSLDEAFAHKASIGSFSAGYTPSGALGGLTAMRNGINTIANASRGGPFFNRVPEDPKEKSLLQKGLEKVGKVVALTAQISAILAGIRFAAAGDSVAEGVRQVGRFKNWAIEMGKKLKNKITGRR